MTFIDATDININAGSGGFGLGAPYDASNPAIQADSGIAPLATLPSLTAPGPGAGSPTAATTSSGGWWQSLLSNPANSTSSTGTPATSATGGTTWSGKIGDWFVRGAVVVTGFIFVAVGLSMFKGESASAAIGRVVPK